MQDLGRICIDLNIDAEFRGVLPNHEIGRFMQSVDVLLLPSITKDGWGVVVSEALMCGTAVVATNCVGASLMLAVPLFGRCVPALSPKAIAQAITDLRNSGSFSSQSRTARANCARRFLSADAGAKYLMEIIAWRFGSSMKPHHFNFTALD
jgi:glycosyltransferase involved in cell wall biosynthesis